MKSFLKVKAPVPLVDRWQCVRIRYPHSSCAQCVISCKCDAVSLRNGININKEQCERCGLCIRYCPSGAMYAEFPSYDTNAFSKKKVIFACKRAEIDEKAEISCIGTLTASDFLHAFSAGVLKLYLYSGRCMECKFNFSIETLKEEIVVANRIADLFGINKKCSLIEDEKSLPAPEINESNNAPISRRRFLRELGRGGMEIVTSFSPEERVTAGKKSYKIPASRRIFIEAVKRIQNENNTGKDLLMPVRFSYIEIGDECNLCGECSSFCPTSALKRKGNSEYIELHFTPSLCVSCDLCRDICPKGSVTILERQYMVSELVEGKDFLLKSIEKQYCTKCGRGFLLEESNSDFCIYCEKQKEMEDWYFSEKGGEDLEIIDLYRDDV